MSSKNLWFGTHAVGSAVKALPASPPTSQIASLGLSRRRQPAEACIMRVGFIGLAPIAQAIASRLLGAGHKLALYDFARDIPEALQSAGGRVANSIEDACRWTDAVFTMLPDDEATEAVVLGSGGVLECLPRKAIHIGASTVSVECSDRIVEAHWDAGKEYVSAPLLVGPESAEVQLFVIAGGCEATIIAIEPLLSPIGRLAQLSGWPSDANLVQLDANCSGANLPQALARHLELRAQQDRLPLSIRAFLDIETKGVLR